MARAFQATAATVVAALAAGGCVAGDDARITADDAPSVVLEVSDLPAGFSVFDQGPIGRADVASGPREDPARFGRQGGWKTRFRRAGSAATDGPIVVESRVDVFESTDGAERDFDAYVAELEVILEQSPAAERLDDPEIGAEAVAITNRQQALQDVRSYTVIWRDGNATASLVAQGFEGRFALEEALELARKQQRRIERVLAAG